MVRLFIYILGGLVALAAIPITGAERPSVAAAIDNDFLGMVIRDPWYDVTSSGPNTVFQDTMGQVLASAGVRWVRLDVHIPVPIDGSSTLVDAEIAKNDYFINVVAPRHGFKVLVLLSFDLVKGADPRELNSTQYIQSSYGGAVNAYMDAWLTRALKIADRYREKVAAYEVLNEENRLPQYRIGGPAGDAIMPNVTARLLTKFYRFCKNIDPVGQNHGCRSPTHEADIILGGLHPRGSSDPANEQNIIMSDASYLKNVYVNDEKVFETFLANYKVGYPVDGIGYHPYPEEIRVSLTDARINNRLPIVRQALSDVGDPCKPLWVTEVGYNVGFDVDGPRGPRPPQTDQGQALFMWDVYTSLAARRLSVQCGTQPEIANVFWFKYEDFPPATGASAQRWGIVRIPFVTGGCPGGACYEPSGAPTEYRASYYTYRELAGKPVYRVFTPIVAKRN